MITKAISWLLRAMVVKNRVELVDFMKVNSNSLPKTEVREVMRKIEIGRK